MSRYDFPGAERAVPLDHRPDDNTKSRRVAATLIGIGLGHFPDSDIADIAQERRDMARDIAQALGMLPRPGQ